MCSVLFFFTRRADSFRGFVGNPNRHEPWVNKIRHNRRVRIIVKLTNGSVSVGRNKRGLSRRDKLKTHRRKIKKILGQREMNH